MTRPTQAVIDTMALRANLAKVRACAPEQHIMAVIKADAYGHDVLKIANALNGLTDAFAVCCLEEALELRSAGIAQPIVLLEGFFKADELPVISAQALHVVVHTSNQVNDLRQTELPKPIHVWIKVDTGMHRLGFMPTDVPTVYQNLQQAPQVAAPVRLMSHLACADDRHEPKTTKQTQRFLSLVSALKAEASLANSAGILGWPQTHVGWVRPGIMLYGVSPFINSMAKEEGLQPVMQLQSILISVKRCRQGDSIGYGASWRCPQAMPIGVVAAGYADGYPRHAPAGTPVLVNGRRVPLIGRVSMDMLTVDLRSQPSARVGDPVVLWGKHLPVEEVASHAGTIAYELLCHINPRVRRVDSA